LPLAKARRPGRPLASSMNANFAGWPSLEGGLRRPRSCRAHGQLFAGASAAAAAVAEGPGAASRLDSKMEHQIATATERIAATPTTANTVSSFIATPSGVVQRIGTPIGRRVNEAQSRPQAAPSQPAGFRSDPAAELQSRDGFVRELARFNEALRRKA
jgi:hypothetical protein